MTPANKGTIRAPFYCTAPRGPRGARWMNRLPRQSEESKQRQTGDTSSTQDAPQQRDRRHLLRQEIIFSGSSHGDEIFFARSDDGGRSFTLPENQSQSTGGDGKGRINRKVGHNGSLDIVAGSDDKVFVAWREWVEYDGQLWFSRSEDRGEHFTAPRVIAGDAAPARAPLLAVKNEPMHVARTTGENNGADIHLASGFSPASRAVRRVAHPRQGPPCRRLMRVSALRPIPNRDARHRGTYLA